jgi:hypothetical protein
MTRTVDAEGREVLRLELYRFSGEQESTLGLLFDATNVNRRFLCFTLEDENRTEKVYAETRIPAGAYNLKLRTEGGLTQKYADRFPDMHKGMIWLQDVFDFEWVYIHVGNTDDDTAGCILVGDTCESNVVGEGRVLGSTQAYRRIYPAIADAIEGDGATLLIVDEEDLA